MFDIYVMQFIRNETDRMDLILAVDGVVQVITNVTPHVAHAYNNSTLAFTQTTCCSATDSVSKVRRSIVVLETLRFCSGNDEKCCTLVYIMSP